MFEVIDKVCMLATAAFVLTLVPALRQRGRALLSVRGQWTALPVFLLLGVVEEAAAVHTDWFNERVVAACASGLVAGPLVGLAVGIFVTGLAVLRDGLPMWTIGPMMLCGGLIGGWIHRGRPELARSSLMGFGLTVGVSWLRAVLTYGQAPELWTTPHALMSLWVAPVLEGLGTALILKIIAQAHDREELTRVTMMAEVRALQARMNPHFLFNALNTLAALAKVAPREIPHAAGRLRHFLRASFDQEERPFVPLHEELAVVRAYLDIEKLRLGHRLRVEEDFAPGVLDASVPPFSLQPLVENAVQHGLHSSPEAGRLWLWAYRAGPFLELSIRDDGQGVPAGEIERVFFEDRPRTHALVLLRRRLQGLFGGLFRLEVHSDPGRGTTVVMCVPLRMTPGASAAKNAVAPAALDAEVLLPHGG